MEKKHVYVIVSELWWFMSDYAEDQETRTDAVCETLETAEAYVEVLIGKYCDNYRGIYVDGTECTFSFKSINRADRFVDLCGSLKDVPGFVGDDIDCGIRIRIVEFELFR